MTMGKVEGDRYLAQCRKCGQWREVRPEDRWAETYFTHWRAEFSCCDLKQRVTFVVEKDELDFH